MVPKPKTRVDWHTYRNVGLMGMVAVALIGYGSYSLLHRFAATHDTKASEVNRLTPASGVITYSTNTPSETKPVDACQQFRAKLGYPERMAIPKLNVSGCIQQVGVDQHGQMAVPSNIYYAGWYTKSAIPGSIGLSIIDGHINGLYTTEALFQHLDKLAPGDTFTVTLGGGKVLHYRVLTTQVMPLGQTSSALFSQNTKVASQLNLITCAGVYSQAIKQFDHRVVVSAALQ